MYSRLDDHTYSFEGKTPLNDFYKVLEIEGNAEEEKGDPTPWPVLFWNRWRIPEIDDVVEFHSPYGGGHKTAGYSA